jgi:hypothetical protein
MMSQEVSKETSSTSVENIPELQCAFAVIPHKRNQDVVSVMDRLETGPTIAVVDGWSNTDFLPGNKPGRDVAEYVNREFPRVFAASRGNTFQERVNNAIQRIDNEILLGYPAHASCVCVFAFIEEKQIRLLAVGSVLVLVYEGRRWQRREEIGNYALDPSAFESNVSRFIGRGELKGKQHYEAAADVVSLPKTTPMLIATDGLEDLISDGEISAILGDPTGATAEVLAKRLRDAVLSKKDAQSDDISFVVCNKKYKNPPAGVVLRGGEVICRVV